MRLKEFKVTDPVRLGLEPKSVLLKSSWIVHDPMLSLCVWSKEITMREYGDFGEWLHLSLGHLGPRAGGKILCHEDFCPVQKFQWAPSEYCHQVILCRFARDWATFSSHSMTGPSAPGLEISHNLVGDAHVGTFHSEGHSAMFFTHSVGQSTIYLFPSKVHTPGTVLQ